MRARARSMAFDFSGTFHSYCTSGWFAVFGSAIRIEWPVALR